VAAAPDGAKLNHSVRKAVALLRATASGSGGGSVSALARDAGLPRATALRLIQTLEAEGLLLRVPGDDRVLLGPELVRLARAADLGTALVEVARARLAGLAGQVRETVTLSATAADGELDLVHQVDGPHHLVPRGWIGRRFPLHASSSGKVLLATYDEARLERFLAEPPAQLTPATITSPRALREELARVRDQGHAVTVDELEEGLAGVSVGVFTDAGALVGTINVSGLSQRLDGAARLRAAERARAVAGDVEAALRQAPGRPAGLTERPGA
jgi:IclR family transcriptional regulator, acetate operon repressor